MNNIMMVYPALVTWLALALYFALAYKVGGARAKHKVMPPLTEGPDEFMRIWRVHQNTTENLMLFLPSLWLFALYLSPVWAAVLGLLWVLARLVYAMGYYQSAEKRLPGFIASILIVAVLLTGALWGMFETVLAVN